MKLNSRARLSRAFTLLEVMVVLVIIGILAALVAPRVSTYISDAKHTAAKTAIESIVSALNSYHSKHGEYPSSLHIVATKYLRKAKLNDNNQLLDPWSIPYSYKSEDVAGVKQQRFSIASAGADNVHGTKDDLSEEGGSTNTQERATDEFDESLEGDLIEEDFQ